MNSKAAARQQAAHQQAAAAQAAAEEIAATQARLAALEQQAAAAGSPRPATVEAPVAPAGDDIIARLQQLADLHRSGILSDDEFEKAKGLVLGG